MVKTTQETTVIYCIVDDLAQRNLALAQTPFRHKTIVQTIIRKQHPDKRLNRKLAQKLILNYYN